MDQLISLKTAKLAKKKGYIDDIWNSSSGTIKFNSTTQTTLSRWLREKHGIHVVVYRDILNKGWYVSPYVKNIFTDENKLLPDFNNNSYPTYEEAFEVALYQALNLM